MSLSLIATVPCQVGTDCLGAGSLSVAACFLAARGACLPWVCKVPCRGESLRCDPSKTLSSGQRFLLGSPIALVGDGAEGRRFRFAGSLGRTLSRKGNCHAEQREASRSRDKLWVIQKMRSGVKAFETWWPGTELNRRRQPFQGCFSALEI